MKLHCATVLTVFLTFILNSIMWTLFSTFIWNHKQTFWFSAPVWLQIWKYLTMDFRTYILSDVGAFAYNKIIDTNTNLHCHWSSRSLLLLCVSARSSVPDTTSLLAHKYSGKCQSSSVSLPCLEYCSWVRFPIFTQMGSFLILTVHQKGQSKTHAFWSCLQFLNLSCCVPIWEQPLA